MIEILFLIETCLKFELGILRQEQNFYETFSTNSPNRIENATNIEYHQFDNEEYNTDLNTNLEISNNEICVNFVKLDENEIVNLEIK